MSKLVLDENKLWAAIDLLRLMEQWLDEVLDPWEGDDEPGDVLDTWGESLGEGNPIEVASWLYVYLSRSLEHPGFDEDMQVVVRVLKNEIKVAEAEYDADEAARRDDWSAYMHKKKREKRAKATAQQDGAV